MITVSEAYKLASCIDGDVLEDAIYINDNTTNEFIKFMTSKYVIPIYYKTKECEVKNGLRHAYNKKRIDIDRARYCLISSIYLCLPENEVTDDSSILQISRLKNHVHRLVDDGIFLDSDNYYPGSPEYKKIQYIIKADITSAFLRSLDNDLACAYMITYIFE